MVSPKPLVVEGAASEWLSCEGVRDAGGAQFLEVKLGLRLPVLAMKDALAQVQRHFAELDALGRGESEQTAASDISGETLKCVVKNTFLTVEDDDRPQLRGSTLARTTTAPPDFSGTGAGSDVVPGSEDNRRPTCWQQCSPRVFGQRMSSASGAREPPTRACHRVRMPPQASRRLSGA